MLTAPRAPGVVLNTYKTSATDRLHSIIMLPAIELLRRRRSACAASVVLDRSCRKLKLRRRQGFAKPQPHPALDDVESVNEIRCPSVLNQVANRSRRELARGPCQLRICAEPCDQLLSSSWILSTAVPTSSSRMRTGSDRTMNFCANAIKFARSTCPSGRS